MHDSLDFTDTKTAFAHLSDAELVHSLRMFSLMNNPFLVKWGSVLGLKSVEWNLPGASWAVKKTIFAQFVGGTSLDDAQVAIKRLAKNNVLTILDYGAEAKELDSDFDHTRDEACRAIECAAKSNIPVVSTKITGMARFELLEKWQTRAVLTSAEVDEFAAVLIRVNDICETAARLGVQVYIDAEETWIQDTIDHIVDTMMERHNTKTAVVFNTFQMYRHDRLDFLKRSLEVAIAGNYYLGAKLVRGAYMEKERKRAEEMHQPSPINVSKEATDELYDLGLEFCIKNADRIHTCCATHNAASSRKFATLIYQTGFEPNDHRFLFSQLLGMSDNITFTLAKAGFRVAKYMPYGSVKEVIPYLIRRAQENSSVTGDMSREYKLVEKEWKRRRS
jgi:proline dehydrogenase